VAGLFAVSFAASAGATVALSGSSEEPGEVAAAPQVSATPDPSSTSPETSVATVSAQDVPKKKVRKPIAPPTPAPQTPTAQQIRKATSSLCTPSSFASLEPVRGVLADRESTRVLEVHAANLGHRVGPIDGFFNDETARGVKSLQQKIDQKPDGTFDAADWQALNTQVCPQPEPVFTPASPSTSSSWSGGSSGSSSGGNSGGNSGGSSGNNSGGNSGGESNGGGTLILEPVE